VVGRLGEASKPKVRAKLQQLLQAAVQGVLANDSVSPSDLLVFIHGVLEAGIGAEEAAQTAVHADAEAPGDSLSMLHLTHPACIVQIKVLRRAYMTEPWNLKRVGFCDLKK